MVLPSLHMSGSDTSTGMGRFGLVRVEVLGRTDHLGPARVAMINELPDYLRAEGFEPDLYYREPGEGETEGVEDIRLFLALGMASGVIGSAAWAALNAVGAWVPQRIRREYPHEDSPLQHQVTVKMYAGDGVRLVRVGITRFGYYYRYIHPDIKGDATE
jgi:hypothetical protein